MIIIKSPKDIEIMKIAGRITAGALKAAQEVIHPGITTKEVDNVVANFIKKHGARPSFLNYGGFPGNSCISINEAVIHGIPSKQKIKEGDIVSIDVGAFYNGFHSDSARTFCVGEVSPEAKKLVEVTEQSFFEGLKLCVAGNRISDVSHAIGSYCESFGYGVVEDYTGHGIGRALHEDPQIPNYGVAGKGAKLMPGMTLAIEPMVNQGTKDIVLLSDGWTVLTRDKKLSAHYENTILITSGDPVILTQCI